MKKYWLIPLMILIGSPYANSCGGQFDPATGTCRIIGPDGKMILYNSAPPQSGYSSGYSNVPVAPPRSDYYAAIAINKATGGWGWSTGQLGANDASLDAIMNCEKAGQGKCEVVATQLSGCLAMASSKDKKGNWTYFFSHSGICGSVEQEALSDCKASKAKNCQIEIRQLDAHYKYVIDKLLWGKFSQD
ncbi:DUF4189 domain-containing protein [Aggregatibacter segnis]|uniref:DUF4189 domain-containing protein n=1 Tax=Aggregatibacter segnis TaxID=739 RepID=UPI000660508D|nr:DUF4189 domain-containing protein [Aggregatibacter segnis]